MSRTQSVKFIASIAMRQYDDLPVGEKIALLNSLAQALTGKDARLAAAMAFNLERLDENQLKFRAVLGKMAVNGKGGKKR